MPDRDVKVTIQATTFCIPGQASDSLQDHWNPDVIRQKSEQNYNMIELQRVTIHQAEGLKSKWHQKFLNIQIFKLFFGTILSLKSCIPQVASPCNNFQLFDDNICLMC